VADLIGVREIAVRAGVSPQAVTNWQKRHAGFPPPLVRLHGGPVFDWAEVEAWLRSTGRYMRRAPSRGSLGAPAASRFRSDPGPVTPDRTGDVTMGKTLFVVKRPREVAASRFFSLVPAERSVAEARGMDMTTFEKYECWETDLSPEEVAARAAEAGVSDPVWIPTA
jgi:hypothetical protein